MSAGWATAKRTRAANRATDTRAARTYLPNRYGGRCWRCGTWLEPDTGLAVPTSHVASERFHDDAQRAYPWQVQHIGDCPVTPAPATGQPTPDVPAGRYAIDGPGGLTFYRVDRPTEGKWVGRTFVSVQAGPNLFPVRDAGARLGILAVIARDPAAASMRYGRELGHCGVCGLELTNQESRARGIGPVCAGKMGW